MSVAFPTSLSHDFYSLGNNQFYKVDQQAVQRAKVICLGWTETRSDHICAIAKFLKTTATTQDLLLIEYRSQGTLIRPSDYENCGPLSILRQRGFEINTTVKGWDNEEHGLRTGRMFGGIEPLSLKVVIKKRNLSIVKAVRDDIDNYQRIFVLTSSLHLCIPPDSTLSQNSIISHYKDKLSKYHSQLHEALREIIANSLREDNYIEFSKNPIISEEDRRQLCEKLSHRALVILVAKNRVSDMSIQGDVPYQWPSKKTQAPCISCKILVCACLASTIFTLILRSLLYRFQIMGYTPNG
jgi:hypothetical protein